MATKTPLQQVKDRFGSKEELAKLVMPKLDRPFEDEADEEFGRRIRTMSNKKLLRLHDALEKLEAGFGSKDALVDAVVALKYGGKTDETARNVLAGYRVTRLLDMHQSLAKAAARAS